MKENDVWKNTLVDAGDIDSIVSAFKLALYQDLLKSYVLAASAWRWIEKEFAPADPDPYGKMLDAMRAAIRAYLDEHRDALEKITAYEPNHQTRWLVAANEVRAQNLGFCSGSVIQPDVLCDLKNNSAFVYEVTGEWPKAHESASSRATSKRPNGDGCARSTSGSLPTGRSPR